MAKLGSYYGLCPLIDNKSLLGITQNAEKGSVVVTLGKNISIKYKLSDQKQLHSWRTKEKFTSPIIYDKASSKYVTVFNHSYLRLWVGEEEHLDKLKKYKFNTAIHTLISDGENTYILFTNGSIKNLNEALESRKTLETDNFTQETIQDVLHSCLKEEFYVGLIIKSENDIYLLWTKCGQNGQKYNKIKLARDGCKLTGYTFHVDKLNVNLLTMWSDGRMFSCQLVDSDLDLSSPGDLFTVIESVSCIEQITMISLNEDYIAMYGPNCNEEGAVLIIYNTQFRVTQSKQHFKMFTIGAKLYCIDNNLFLPVGQNLAVVPFCLDTEQLAALVGSHKAVEGKLDSDISIVHELEIARWTSKNKTFNVIPKELKEKIEEYSKQGLPESIIIEAILPEILEKKDVKLLNLCLKHFCDISEKNLAKILKFLLSAENAVFENISKKLKLKRIPAELEPSHRCKMIDEVLNKSFSDVLLLPYLRSELQVEEILLLIKYLSYLLSNDGHKFRNSSFVNTEAKVIDWGCIIIDSNYQKLLLTKDDKIAEVINQFNTQVKEHLNSLEDLRQIAPILNEIKCGKDIVKGYHCSSLSYSIEKLSLY